MEAKTIPKRRQRYTQTTLCNKLRTKLKPILSRRGSLIHKEDKMGRVCSMGDNGNASRTLIGKIEGKRLLRRPRLRWDDNIKIDLRGAGSGVGTS
jgi:hypothetical protein